MPPVTSFSGTVVRLAALPSAEAEARWLAGRLGAALLTAGQATEWMVRRRLPGAPLIHLATHGYAFSSEARSRQSFVALAPGRGHDGVLSVGEVLDDPTLRLNAELVVLSACQTGLGDLRQAEGTVGLQRAFLAKGARSVLVSLWSVSDAVTSLLMKRFYTHWLDDRNRPSKAEALRLAQEDVRATPGYQHPRFWAAFQLVGAR
jgi:CHAT domain-containing protein